jgi:hypothetical protein
MEDVDSISGVDGDGGHCADFDFGREFEKAGGGVGVCGGGRYCKMERN